MIAFTIGQTVLVGIAVFASAIIAAVAGFGFALLSVPLMSLAIDLHSAVIISSLVALASNAVQNVVYRGQRDRGLTNRLSIAAIAGLPVGYLVYVTLDDRALRVILFVGVVTASLLLARGLNLSHVGNGFDYSMGFVAGVLSTSISTSGPPLAFDLQARRCAPQTFRATINAVFLITNIVGVALFAIGGEIDRHDLLVSAIVAPAMGLGLAVGLPLRRHVSPARFQVMVTALLLAGAVAALAKAFA